MTYAILQISAAAYKDIRGRLTALDEKLNPDPTYASEYIWPADRMHPELLNFGQIALEALPAETQLEVDDATRGEVAAILETIAKDGLPGPRDLDVALDAIFCTLRPK